MSSARPTRARDTSDVNNDDGAASGGADADQADNGDGALAPAMKGLEKERNLRARAADARELPVQRWRKNSAAACPAD
eukprot:6454406-Pyramimonas_sp.AAC.1